MSKLSPPPVPAKLREIFKDYPGHIARLQEALNALLADPAPGVDPFERAVWLLEGRIETFAQEARAELETAEAGGDASAIEKAQSKRVLVSSAAFKSRWITDRALEDYIHANQEAFA